MKIILRLTILIGLFTSGSLMSQKDPSNSGKESRYNKMYDQKTIVQIKGEITAVEQIPPNKGF